MSLPTEIEQHCEIGILELAPWAWGKPRIAALLAAFLDQVQALESNLWSIMRERELPAADIARLKVLGKLIGQPRFGLSLEAYRTVLEARGLANVSKGTGRDLFRALDVLLDGPNTYLLVEAGDATLLLSVLGEITSERIKMVSLVLPDVRAAGVGLQVLATTDANVFRWDDAWGAPEVWGTVRVL